MTTIQERERNRIQTAKWRAAHPEEYKAYCREYYKKNREKLVARKQESIERQREKDPEKFRRWGRVTYEKHKANGKRFEYAVTAQRKMRLRVFAAIGTKCARCGFSDWRALNIDHIEGGGNEERRLYKGKLWAYYKHIIEVGPSKYQTLCANCNTIKQHEERESYRNRKRKELNAQSTKNIRRELC